LSKSKIVVFDSGTGGRLFAEFLHQELPHTQITPVIDSENAPYGSKKPATICNLVESALNPHINQSDTIVIACNTATANAIEYLRDKYPNQFFVSFEPAVKPAGEQTKTKNVMVLATNATFKAPRYQRLRNKYCNSRGVTVYEPDCRKWAKLIDTNTISDTDIEKVLKPYLNQDIDFIALACTHYVAIQDRIQNIVGPNVTVFNPFAAVASYIKSQLR